MVVESAGRGGGNAVLEAYAEGLHGIDQWLRSLGGALWDLLDAAVRARDIPVRFGTAAERLLIADDGSVTGLAVGDGGLILR